MRLSGNRLLRLGIGLLVVLSITGASPCAAQNPSFSGTVRDPGGKPLANVAVEFSTRSQGRSITGTDESGKYAFSGVPPGDYEVSFELSGFDTAVRVIHVTFGGERNGGGKAGDVTLIPKKDLAKKK